MLGWLVLYGLLVCTCNVFLLDMLFSIIVYGLFILSVAIVMDCWISHCPIRSVF